MTEHMWQRGCHLRWIQDLRIVWRWWILKGSLLGIHSMSNIYVRHRIALNSTAVGIASRQAGQRQILLMVHHIDECLGSVEGHGSQRLRIYVVQALLGCLYQLLLLLLYLILFNLSLILLCLMLLKILMIMGKSLGVLISDLSFRLF